MRGPPVRAGPWPLATVSYTRATVALPKLRDGMTVMARPKSPTAGAKPATSRSRGSAPAGKGPRGNNMPRSRSGQGSGSALAEMLRRQAQNPRPGAGQQPPREAADDRGARPTAPRRPPG